MTHNSAIDAEINLLTNADFLVKNALDPEAHYPISVTKAMLKIYEPMLDMLDKYPESAGESLFIQYWGETVSSAYERVVLKALEQDPTLESTEWLRQYFDPHLEVYVRGERSIPAYLDYLDANRHLLPEAVSNGWNPAAREHHDKYNGDCGAGGGCPSEQSCGVSIIVQAQQARAEQAVAQLREKYGDIQR